MRRQSGKKSKNSCHYFLTDNSEPQEHFAVIVARYERLRSQMRESTRQAELLFQGLLALSFTEGLWESFGEQYHPAGRPKSARIPNSTLRDNI